MHIVIFAFLFLLFLAGLCGIVQAAKDRTRPVMPVIPLTAKESFIRVGYLFAGLFGVIAVIGMLNVIG